jgi:2-iminobutanoate/2-iminopropanoate deaminase
MIMRRSFRFVRNTLFLMTALALGMAIGASAQKMTERRHIKPANSTLQQLPFSDGVLVGDTLYVAGHIGIDPKTGNVPADVDTEIKLLFDSFKETLTQGGAWPWTT